MRFSVLSVPEIPIKHYTLYNRYIQYIVYARGTGQLRPLLQTTQPKPTRPTWKTTRPIPATNLAHYGRQLDPTNK